MSSEVKMGVGWWMAELERMTQRELAELRRFSPPGHIVFVDDRLTDQFNRCFAARGGMTADISKEIGWGKS